MSIVLAAAAALSLLSSHHVIKVKPVSVEDTHGFDPGWRRHGTPPVDPALAPEPDPAPISAPFVNGGPKDRPRVALTFDGCPTSLEHGGFRRDIVDFLRSEHVPATFFLSSRWAEWRPEVVRELAADPLFEVESHGARHVDLSVHPAAEVRQNLDESRRVLTEITGTPPRFLRPPACTMNDTVVSEAGALGMRVVGCGVVADDAEVHFSDAKVERIVLDGVQPGSIVGMHVNGQAIHTLAALQGIVRELRAQGYELVTLSELLDGTSPLLATARVSPNGPGIAALRARAAR